MLKMSAQDLYFKSYTTKDGLSQNSPYSITQTPDGFMWFGTQNGINRFDSRFFKKISFKLKKGMASPSEMITCMHVDKAGNFWVGTPVEVFLFDYKTDSIYPVTEKFPFCAVKDQLWTLSIQETRDYLCIHQVNKLTCMDKKNQKMVVFNEDFFHEPIVDVSVSKDNDKFFLATASQLYMLTDQMQWMPLKTDNYFSDKKTQIRAIGAVGKDIWIITTNNKIVISKVDQPGNIIDFDKIYAVEKPLIDPVRIHQSDSNTAWIGSRTEGVLKVNLSDKSSIKAEASFEANSLLKNFILSFYTNTQGITWIGVSGAGVAKHDPANQQFGLWRIKPTSRNAVHDNFITAIFTDDGQNFYLSTMTGGLLYLNVATNENSYHIPPESQQFKTDARNMYTIIRGDKNTLWVATWGGLCSFNTQTRKYRLYNDSDGKTIQLSSLIKLKNKNKLFVAGYKMGFKYFNLDDKKWEEILDPENSMANNGLFRGRYIHQLNDDELLIGAESGCLVKYNMKSGIFTKYPQFYNISNKCAHFTITQKYWWIGTTQGLIQADAHSQEIMKVWNTKAGLSDDVIYAVLEDKSGHIWVSTNRGLNMINTKNGTVTKYNEEDGLQGSEFNTASCIKDAEGNLWFGGLDGLNKVDHNFQPIRPESPQPFIIKIQVLNEDYVNTVNTPYVHDITLAPQKNFINIEYQTLNYSQTENIIYRHRLLGLDSNWVMTGSRNFVNFTKLKPGNYTLELASANSNLEWSDSRKLNIKVLPFWYQTPTFFALSFILILSILTGAYKYRVTNIRKASALKNKLVETEMAALKAQMNPHFIFNCINSIDAYIHLNDKYHASMYLNKFARLIRNILDSSKQNLVSLEKDIETMQLYITLEEMRSNNKFTSKFEVDPALTGMDIRIPSLIVQPYIENAIIHGLRNREGDDGILSINISRDNEYIKYIIEDNGIGRQPASMLQRNKDNSYGLQLSESRLSLFNNEDKSQVKIHDLYKDGNPAGTRVEVMAKVFSK
jgi:ligand-binding sensor domain-containing protein/anti-sigma regulatory factor (Ser/Thr protein kinase)